MPLRVLQCLPSAFELRDVSVLKPRTAALWTRQGRIPAYRIGRKWGFKWEELVLALPKTIAASGDGQLNPRWWFQLIFCHGAGQTPRTSRLAGSGSWRTPCREFEFDP